MASNLVEICHVNLNKMAAKLIQCREFVVNGLHLGAVEAKLVTVSLPIDLLPVSKEITILFHEISSDLKLLLD